MVWRWLEHAHFQQKFCKVHVSCDHGLNIKYQMPSKSLTAAYDFYNTDIKFPGNDFIHWWRRGLLAPNKKTKFGTTRLLENCNLQTNNEIDWYL